MMRLPDALVSAVMEDLRGIGDSTSLQDIRPVGGGCIHNTCCLETEKGRYLLKWSAGPLPSVFVREAEGLRLLRNARAVRIPEVLAVGGTSNAYLLLEWIASSGVIRGAQLGEQLAALHRVSAAAYGLDGDNFIGATPQINGWDTDWLRFFRERRLRPQIELAQRNGYLTVPRRQRLDRLIQNLDTWLGGVSRQPCLLHGDLWGGNVMSGPGGEPVLIDPAVYFGDRETEIAFTTLFGGFSGSFYQAYQTAWPLEPGYAERFDLYNLYHLLNHLNLFGEGYASSVDAVLRRYVG